MKTSDLIDAWNDNNTLERMRNGSIKNAKTPTSRSPPNMVSNDYTKNPRMGVHPNVGGSGGTPQHYNTMRSNNSGYSGTSSDRQFEKTAKKRPYNSRNNSVDSSVSNGVVNGAFTNTEYPRKYSHASSRYSRQNSQVTLSNGYPGYPEDFSVSTLPPNYSRQSSHQSNHSSFQNNNGGFQTMPHPHYQQDAKPQTYPKPNVPKRTTSLNQLNQMADEEENIYEVPLNLRGSQSSLYGYSTSLPQ